MAESGSFASRSTAPLQSVVDALGEAEALLGQLDGGLQQVPRSTGAEAVDQPRQPSTAPGTVMVCTPASGMPVSWV